MSWGTDRREPINWSAVLDNVLTVLSVVILILSLVSTVSSRNGTYDIFAARFWHVWGGVLRTLARIAGQGALQAETAYWAAIEKVRR